MNQVLIFAQYQRYLAVLIIFCALSGLDAQDLGRVDFSPTGSEVAKPYFEKGLLLLHHFRYEEAAKEFQMAQLLDPELIMAYWGEAKCYDKAFWYHQDAEKARGVLYKLGVRKEKRLERAKNDIERAFLNSVEELFSEEGSFKQRQLKYNAALREMHNQFSGESEVTAFFALSLLTIRPWHDDESAYDEALDLLELVLEKNSEHPGALNYTLHGCATPDKAYKARKAVKSYPSLGTNLPYCNHLPSHVYLVTGQWNEFVEANKNAWELAEKLAKSNKVSLEDRDYHSLWWLTYGLLQQGKFKQAEEYVKDMNQTAKYSSQSVKLRYYLAMMKASFLFETDQWNGLIGEKDVPSKGFTIGTKSLNFYMEGMKAISNDDLSRADWYVMQMQDQRTVEKNKPTGGVEFYYCDGQPSTSEIFPTLSLKMAEVMELSLKAIKYNKEKSEKDAIDLMEQAVSIESSIINLTGLPVTGRPASEIFGEILLNFNKPGEAIEQFDFALKKYPNRTKSLLGKYRAYNMLGDKENASAFKKMVLVNWESADPEVLATVDNL
jgi:tetratricopeptide (TPR) repeat protein